MQNKRLYEAMRPGRVAQVAVRDRNYAINEWGDENSPLLVYLHGWGDTGSTFQFVVDAFREDWFVVAPDWRGFGRTGGGASAYWFPDYLADLDHLLGHYSPDAPVNLVGHSMGGNIAGLYAGAMPERVARFVNLEGFGLIDTDPNDAPARYRSWIERGRKRPVASERESFETLARQIRGNAPGMSAPQADFVAREWATEQASGRIRLRADPAHKLPNPILYRRAEAEACWRKTTAPVLLVVGRNSPYGAHAELPFANRQTRWIEDAGHMLHFEQPSELAHVIEEFLAKPNT